MARESRFFVHNSLPSRLEDYHVRVPIILHVCENQSVWKGICETQDFAKYCVGFKKTQNILTGYGISLLPWDRDLPKFGDGMYDIFFCLSRIREIVRIQTFKRQMRIDQIDKTSVKKVRVQNNPSRGPFLESPDN